MDSQNYFARRTRYLRLSRPSRPFVPDIYDYPMEIAGQANIIGKSPREEMDSRNYFARRARYLRLSKLCQNHYNITEIIVRLARLLYKDTK